MSTVTLLLSYLLKRILPSTLLIKGITGRNWEETGIWSYFYHLVTLLFWGNHLVEPWDGVFVKLEQVLAYCNPLILYTACLFVNKGFIETQPPCPLYNSYGFYCIAMADMKCCNETVRFIGSLKYLNTWPLYKFSIWWISVWRYFDDLRLCILFKKQLPMSERFLLCFLLEVLEFVFTFLSIIHFKLICIS